MNRARRCLTSVIRPTPMRQRRIPYVGIYFILCHFNQSRAQNKGCWHGCPPDHQVNFSGWPQDFVVVQILGHKNMKKSQIQPPI